MAFPEWRVAAASVCGVSHVKISRPCQDAHDWVTLPGGILVAAVADGSGSAALGEVGATLAARAVVEAICQRWLATPTNSGSSDYPTDDSGSVENPWNAGPGAKRANDARPEAQGGARHTRPSAMETEDWRAVFSEAFSRARDTLVSAAAARDVPEQDLATTLSVVVAWPDGAAAAQIGDGAVVVGDRPETVLALSTPAKGEYLNETVFLTSTGALEDLPVNVWHGPVAHLALLSDGLQMLALQMPAGVPHPPFFAPLFHYLATVGKVEMAGTDLAAFLGSPRILERADDDLTLLLAVLRR